jgi:hypothetical protein
MAAGVSDRPLETGMIMNVVQAFEAKRNKRGPYKKKNATLTQDR